MLRRGWILIALCMGLVGLTSEPIWAQQSNNPNCSNPNLLLVLDVSGSMSNAGKLGALKQAIKDVLLAYQNKLRFGMVSFSGTGAKVEVPLGPDTPAGTAKHTQALIAASQKFNALGGTPMTAAMKKANEFYLNALPNDPIHKLPGADVKRASFVLLMTDGEPTDGDPLPQIKLLRKLKVGGKLYDIKTFVVGLGSNQDIRSGQLQKFAIAGGTVGFYHAKSAGQLSEVFKKISKSASNKEVCNGKDDDCDGKTDEDLKRDCKNDCGTGKQICNKGVWGPCDAPPPGKEICDGRDNNCNGKVDEGLRRACKTDCGSGFQSCIRGDWNSCDAQQPAPEICNGKDDDCDGKIDNKTPCPNGKCVEVGKTYKCDIDCQGQECPKGYRCNPQTKKCDERPCNKKKCKAGEICSDNTGVAVCQNLCAGVTCPAGKTCGAQGTCIDCYQDDCPPNTICLDGKCTPDKCNETKCAKEQGCRDGGCFDLCKCKQGDVCIKGVCQADACAKVTCPSGKLCLKGLCVDNKCGGASGTTCGKGFVCEPASGVCGDDPCLRTRCPGDATCVRGECYAKGTKPNLPKGQCSSDADCSDPSQSCKSGVCLAKNGGGNGNGTGGCDCAAISGGKAGTNPLMLSFWLFCFLFGFRRWRRHALR